MRITMNDRLCVYLAWLLVRDVESQLTGVTLSLPYACKKEVSGKVLWAPCSSPFLFSISCKRRCSMVQGTAVEPSDRANHPLDAGHGTGTTVTQWLTIHPRNREKEYWCTPKATGNGSALLHSVIQSNDAAGSSSNNNTSLSSTTQQQQPPAPVTATDVDDPSHPLFRHRRTVTDFDYGPILGEGSYSTVGDIIIIIRPTCIMVFNFFG